MKKTNQYIIREKMTLEAIIRCECSNFKTRKIIRGGKLSFAERVQSEIVIQNAEYRLSKLEINPSL